MVFILCTIFAQPCPTLPYPAQPCPLTLLLQLPPLPALLLQGQPRAPREAGSSKQKRQSEGAEEPSEPEPVYCPLCKLPDYGRDLVECDTCAQWFHPECAGVTMEVGGWVVLGLGWAWKGSASFVASGTWAQAGASKVVCAYLQ